MRLGRLLLLAGLGALGVLWAHPMGNFSVSHYARIEARPGGTEILYVLDLAEIPTFELLQEWKMDPATPREQIKAKVDQQARQWVSQLAIAANGKPVKPKVEAVEMAMTDGAGNMPVLRVTSHLKVTAAPGTLTYSDSNYEQRAGWKEVVVAAGPGASVSESSAPLGRDRSQGLTVYPTDPSVSPPQEVTASLTWSGSAPIAAPAPAPVPVPVAAPPKPPAAAVTDATTPAPSTAPVVEAPTAPPNKQPATSPTLAQQQQAPGTVNRGDYLSQLLSRQDLGFGLILVGLCVAFGLGAMHALSPGHGKTLVAAYLVGTRGTAKHALFLGAMVTFTHTVSVFALGFVTMFLSQYILPETIFPILGAVSGLSIVVLGAMLLYRRAKALAAGGELHSHSDEESQSAEEMYAAVRAEVYGHSREGEHSHEGYTQPHSHGSLVHSHDGHTHSHMPEGKVSMGSLMALGASGGLVPCPSAMVLMLSAFTLGRIGFGLLLLVAFSLGLAVVLTVIGLLVVYAKNLLPERSGLSRHPLFRLVPVLSAAVVTIVGLVMTGVALGWIKAENFLS